MARVPKQITGNAGAFDAIKKGGKEFKEVGAGKITHFNNGKKAPLKEDVTAGRKGAPGFPNARAVSPEEAAKLTGRHNSGKGAPNFENWTNDGGWLKYDDATGTVIYGKNMETSTHGTRDVEVPYNGRDPDFSNYTVESVEIPAMNGVRSSKDLSVGQVHDFRQSWNALEAQKARQYEDAGIPKDQALQKAQEDIEQQYGVKRGPKSGEYPETGVRGRYTWHHTDKGMVLVDKNVHGLFDHYGAASDKRAGQ